MSINPHVKLWVLITDLQKNTFQGCVDRAACTFFTCNFPTFTKGNNLVKIKVMALDSNLNNDPKDTSEVSSEYLNNG